MNANLAKRIIEFRKKQKLTQVEVAKVLQISRPSYIDIEKGMKDITIPQLNILAKLFKTNPQELQFKTTSSTAQQSVMPKFKEIILNCVQFGSSNQDGRITKTKLAKLVYLAEFKWFYDNLKPLTGLSYKRLEHGPVPNAYFRAIDELFESGQIYIESRGPAFMISLNETAPQDLLSQQEVETIKAVAEKWQAKNTQEIVAFTHNQLPWKISRPEETIPYELITQEDPDNVY